MTPYRSSGGEHMEQGRLPRKRRFPVITVWTTVSPESGERRKSVFSTAAKPKATVTM